MAQTQGLDQLAAFGVTVNPTARLDGTVRFERKVVLFNNVAVRDCTFGSYSYAAPYAHLLFADVGRYCSVGNNVAVGGSNHPLDHVSTSPAFYDGVFGPQAWPPAPFDRNGERVTIGPDVWLGAHVKVLPGVKIGAGAVVGMGSVVTKDVEPFAIVVGNPARLVRHRFDDVLRQRLTALQWWDYDWPGAPDAAGLSWSDPAATVSRMEDLVARGAVQPLAGAVVEVRR
ncbi:CatB-related O-acetyltransferase [Alsobacter sp. R-9]